MVLAGGHSDDKEPTKEVIDMVEALKDAILASASVESTDWTVVSFTSQVVAGTNYMVKINAGGEHVHAKIFKGLPHTGGNAEVKGERRSLLIDSALSRRHPSHSQITHFHTHLTPHSCSRRVHCRLCSCSAINMNNDKHKVKGKSHFYKASYLFISQYF